MELIGIILLIVIGFVILGIGGWILEILSYIFDFLMTGFFKSFGCLFWIFVILFVLYIIGL